MTRTVFQIKQKILDQLNLSLNWSKHAINESYGQGTISSVDKEELSRIRTEIKGLMKEIDKDKLRPHSSEL